MSGPMEMLYFPLRNRQTFQVKKILSVDTKKALHSDRAETLICYLDDDGTPRQILVEEHLEQ